MDVNDAAIVTTPSFTIFFIKVIVVILDVSEGVSDVRVIATLGG